MKRIWIVLACAGIVACGGGGDEGGSNDSEFQNGDQSREARFLNLDVNDASALFTVESSGSTVSSESVAPSKSLDLSVAKGSSSSTATSQIQKVDSSGNVVDALRVFAAESEEKYATSDTKGLESTYHENLPRISYLGVSPKNEAFILFERCLVYQDKTTINGVETSIKDYKGGDSWSCSSPFTCQIFKLNKKISDASEADKVQKSNLTCLSNSLEINTWDFRSGLMQFDSSGNAYFSAHVPGNWKNVLIKYSADTGALAEVINANICYRDFLVTSGGGILYTGMTSSKGDCNGSAFFRYVNPQGGLQEITRGWWEFTSEYIKSGTYAGQVVFYGPDTASTAPSWDSACIRRFNPGASDADANDGKDDRSTLLAECRNDMWGWINGGSTNAIKQARCEAQKYLLGSSGVPKKILVADLAGDGNQEIYVIGSIKYKQKGTWMSGDWCQQPNNNWNTEYTGLARIADLVGGTDPTDNITLLSTTSETVNNAWVVNNRLFYSSSIAGTYYLKEYKVADASIKTLLSGIEVYELSKDPASATKIFVNGLNFSTNKYIVGSFDPDATSPQATLATNDKLTGVVETIVILSK